MRATIRRDSVKIEFSGRGQIWNDLLRPYFGGPEAPPEPERVAAPPAAPPAAAPASAPVARPATVQFTPHRPEIVVQPAPVAAAARPSLPSQPRTWYPPRPETPPRRFEPDRNAPPQHYYSAEEDESDAVQVEPSADPATLYARLAAIPGRRSERDAVLAAVWFLTKGEHETTADDVEAHFQMLRVFPDIKVTPHLLKHIHRTKMLEQGASPKAVKFSKKGLGSVRGRLVPV